MTLEHLAEHPIRRAKHADALFQVVADLVRGMHVARVEKGDVDGIRGRVEAYGGGGETMTEPGGQELHQLGNEYAVADLRAVDPCKLLLESGLVQGAGADESASERHALRDGRMQGHCELLLRNRA